MVPVVVALFHVVLFLVGVAIVVVVVDPVVAGFVDVDVAQEGIVVEAAEIAKIESVSARKIERPEIVVERLAGEGVHYVAVQKQDSWLTHTARSTGIDHPPSTFPSLFRYSDRAQSRS